MSVNRFRRTSLEPRSWLSYPALRSNRRGKMSLSARARKRQMGAEKYYHPPYIGGMAHNNGMFPRSRKGRGVSDNAAKHALGAVEDRARGFKGAVEAGPSLAEAANLDPAYLAPPLAAMTAGGTFVPHRPARPEK